MDDFDFVPPSGGPSGESVVLSHQLDYASRPISWPTTWSTLLDDFRRAAVPPVFGEISGTAGVTAALGAEGLANAPPHSIRV